MDTQKKDFFTCFSQKIAKATGSHWAFCTAFIFVVIWAASGPIFKYSDTWQLIINTITSITTFLMVFLIQNTQNKDTAALQIKIDELVHVTEKARNSMLDLENMSDSELEKFRNEFREIAEKEK